MSLGKELYRYYDEYGPLQVFDDGNKRYLSFGDGDEQSCQLKSDPLQLQHDYSRAMLLVLLFKEPKNVILFGLGGGTLATTMHHYIPTLKLRVVELRSQVVDVAYRYFQFPRSERIDVFTEDASEFLDNTEQSKTDVLFSDIYGEEGLDLQQTQPWFIERCAELLNDDGWLVLNCWQLHRGDKEMMTALKTHFADVRVSTTSEGNWVILAGKKADQSSATQLKAAAKKWSTLLGYSLLSSYGQLKQVC
ncbi:Spermidine synthase [marine gamma proteobacterium HTCC2143]|jgi:spermidine synthase|uniref:Spermidine synthase n=1 Tax=marine gamma proteobacterium HTCC2143 TaxID=247633 RepID=A0YCX6_9GAMM|nr:Spermidine synthase [marine gamma proteobacterium HTCC2143]